MLLKGSNFCGKFSGHGYCGIDGILVHVRPESPPYSVILTHVLCTIYIDGVFDRLWQDSLSMKYVDKESCHCLWETPPILGIKHVSK